MGDITEGANKRRFLDGLSEVEEKELWGSLTSRLTPEITSWIGPDGTLRKQADLFSKKIMETERELTRTTDPEHKNKLEKRIESLRTARTQTLNQRELEENRVAHGEYSRRLEEAKSELITLRNTHADGEELIAKGEREKELEGEIQIERIEKARDLTLGGTRAA